MQNFIKLRQTAQNNLNWLRGEPYQMNEKLKHTYRKILENKIYQTNLIESAPPKAPIWWPWLKDTLGIRGTWDQFRRIYSMQGNSRYIWNLTALQGAGGGGRHLGFWTETTANLAYKWLQDNAPLFLQWDDVGETIFGSDGVIIVEIIVNGTPPKVVGHILTNTPNGPVLLPPGWLPNQPLPALDAFGNPIDFKPIWDPGYVQNIPIIKPKNPGISPAIAPALAIPFMDSPHSSEDGPGIVPPLWHPPLLGPDERLMGNDPSRGGGLGYGL